MRCVLGWGVGLGNEQPEGGAVGCLLHKRSKAQGVPNRIDTALVLHFDRQPSVANSEDKVNLPVLAPLRLMGNAQTRNA